MNILISNDDGYQAEGIIALADALSRIANVVVIAPNENKSAASSALSVTKILTPVQVAPNRYYMDGTPSDCVHTALCGFLDQPFDLVVSGINLGVNLGDDVIYSGTVAAAIEGRFLGLPSIAISLAGDAGGNFATAAQVAVQLVQQIEHTQLPSNTILNVNVPDLANHKIKGFKTTRLGSRHASEGMIELPDTPGSFKIGRNGKPDDNRVGSDFYAIKHGFVSITPLQIDLTNYRQMPILDKWLDLLNA